MWKGFDLAEGRDETVIDIVTGTDEGYANALDDIISGLIVAGCSLEVDISANVFPNSPDKRLEIVVRGRVRYIVRKDMK